MGCMALVLCYVALFKWPHTLLSIEYWHHLFNHSISTFNCFIILSALPFYMSIMVFGSYALGYLIGKFGAGLFFNQSK